MSEQIAVKQPWESFDLKALSQAIADKNEEQRTFYKANKDKWDDDRVTIFESRSKELQAMSERQQKLQKVEDIYQQTVEQKKSLEEPAPHVPFENNGGNTSITQTGGAFKSVGEAFTESMAYKSIGDHMSYRGPNYSVTVPFNFLPGQKATFSEVGSSYIPSNPRSDIVTYAPQRMPKIAEVIPIDPTANTVVSYMEETTALAGTNAQVGTAEAAAKFENTLAFTERTATVGLVATWLPVTNQVLDDIPNIQSIINNRLTAFLLMKEEDMLMTGAGAAPEYIAGFLDNAWASMQTQARGTDTNLDAVFKAMQLIRTVGYTEPDVVIMHPTNFTPINLYKSTSGNYSFDVTATQGITQLFGKTLVLSPAITLNTALVGNFAQFSHISRRQGLTITVGLNGTDFTFNQKSILGEFRESLEIYRQTAFCKVTGLQ